jgi:hypothetical protein
MRFRTDPAIRQVRLAAPGMHLPRRTLSPRRRVVRLALLAGSRGGFRRRRSRRERLWPRPKRASPIHRSAFPRREDTVVMARPARIAVDLVDGHHRTVAIVPTPGYALTAQQAHDELGPDVKQPRRVHVWGFKRCGGRGVAVVTAGLASELSPDLAGGVVCGVDVDVVAGWVGRNLRGEREANNPGVAAGARRGRDQADDDRSSDLGRS